MLNRAHEMGYTLGDGNIAVRIGLCHFTFLMFFRSLLLAQLLRSTVDTGALFVFISLLLLRLLAAPIATIVASLIML
jgi:hypothetical protein